MRTTSQSTPGNACCNEQISDSFNQVTSPPDGSRKQNWRHCETAVRTLSIGTAWRATSIERSPYNYFTFLICLLVGSASYFSGPGYCLFSSFVNQLIGDFHAMLVISFYAELNYEPSKLQTNACCKKAVAHCTCSESAVCARSSFLRLAIPRLRHWNL